MRENGHGGRDRVLAVLWLKGSTNGSMLESCAVGNECVVMHSCVCMCACVHVRGTETRLSQPSLTEIEG